MTEYDDTNRGILFREKEKTNPKAPDYKGKVDVEGVEWRIAGWIRTSGKDGSRFLSLSIEKPWTGGGGGSPGSDGERAQEFQKPAETPKQDDFDDSIPF